MTPRAVSTAVALSITVLLALTAVLLVTAVRPIPDRVQDLSERLRCPVCKSVSVAESPSETATAMRQVVADQVAGGRTDAEVVDYFRARYGDWVLLDPPTAGATLAVWLVPAIAAALGVLVVLTRTRRRRDAPTPELPAPADRLVDSAVARARADLDDREDGL
ncbi:cytochrome c-type biogenesis protein CcmH [Pseudonocardia sp. KRD291]|uniref:cytochrome c-type biogenesis protein n=1 Tax=Pseudonocardia sp. KRD291 TaxID=2792007 RepID=UPI001C49F4A2|nr:cytochrome c-type biogenesis protein CcmH [Pseudonocardia sp. KRD291]MBW0104184.1 cytochrome c-type biogenesis protein CcmH [Pseudonocardia sp. KRD291]